MLNIENISLQDIPFQYNVAKFLWNFDYSTGNPEVLLSGAYGSSKSTLAAYLIIRHCMENPKARFCIGRRALPDLKRTVFKEIIELLEGVMVEGVHYESNISNASIRFQNGSEIVSASWADRKYKKFRSLRLSGLFIEEATENDEDDKEAFMTLKARVRRIPEVKQNFVILATNPDSPRHWLYKYFMESDSHTRRVFYSKTEDNCFLDPVYIDQLKRDLGPREVKRYLYGEWLDIYKEQIYYAYTRDTHFKDQEYSVDPHRPVWISFDFNIGEGKPMSAVLLQFDRSHHAHVFDEIIIYGGRTLDVCEEIENRGYLSSTAPLMVSGDASGRSRDTRGVQSDYDIIFDFLARKGVNHANCVPLSNPRVRERHNIVNGFLLNSLGQRFMTIYNKCETVDEALRLTGFKRGSTTVEDDSKAYQHVGTALGYALCEYKSEVNKAQVGVFKR